MWRNMDDRLERRRELLIPGALGEENIGGWREAEGNGFPRLILPKMDDVGRSVYRKVPRLMSSEH